MYFTSPTPTRETRLTILISKLTFWSADASGLGSIEGMVSSHAETYIIGADTKVLITMPEVICKKSQIETRTELIRSPAK